MKKHEKHQGFALALLLWMIAGMSLMVLAVIHSAKSDISMAEQHLQEARARAAARGAALLVLRDYEVFGRSGTNADSREFEPQAEPERREFSRQYSFGSGLTVTARLRPANAYTSLNDADPEELQRLLEGMGGLDRGAAMAVADSIIDYRDISSEQSTKRINFDGFRAREELLAIPGFPRDVYDRIKDFVHPYRSGQMDPSLAPEELSSELASDDTAGGVRQSGSSWAASSNVGSSGGGEQKIGGLVTFDAIWEAKRRATLGLGGGSSVLPVETVTNLPSGGLLRQRIWLSADGYSIVRSEPAQAGNRSSG